MAVELQVAERVYAVYISRETLTDWSAKATLRKLLCSIALFASLCAIAPTVHLQSRYVESPDQVRLTDLERRTSTLEALPERQAQVEIALKNLKEDVDSLNTRAWLILAAALAALLDRFLNAFGIKVRGGAE